MIHATPQDAAQCQDLAQQCIANERQQYKRDQKQAKYYEPMKRRMKAQYRKMKKKREKLTTGAASKPWNNGYPQDLHLCESVRAFLGVRSTK